MSCEEYCSVTGAAAYYYREMREAMENFYGEVQALYEASTDEVETAEMLQVMNDVNWFEDKMLDWDRCAFCEEA